MSNKKVVFFGSFVIFFVVVAIYATLRFSVEQVTSDVPSGDQIVVCTMEAKLCPDGSSVGRSGPKCEFASCPEASNVSSVLGRSVVQNGLNITPIMIVEDSRCPVDVQCIQAGRLVVKTRFERVDGFGGVKELNVELGKSVEVLGMWVNLVTATSAKDENYSFTFIAKTLTR